MASKLQKAAAGVAALGTIGTVVAGCLVFDLETGTLQQIKLGQLAVFDRKRMEARRARRAAARKP